MNYRLLVKVKQKTIGAVLLGVGAVLAISLIFFMNNVIVARDSSHTVRAMDDSPGMSSFAESVAGLGDKMYEGQRDVVLTVDSTRMEIRTEGSSVGALLSEAGIIIGPHDKVSHELGSPVWNGMEITVIRLAPAQEAVKSAIPASVAEESARPAEAVPLSVSAPDTAGAEELHNTVKSDRSAIAPKTGGSSGGSALSRTGGMVSGSGVITLPGGETLTYSKALDVQATAYTTEGMRQKHNALGKVARVGTIAVDPRVIPLRSKVYVTSGDGTSWFYGIAVCEDTGGAIKGNIIDLYFDTRSECINFGRRSAKIYVLE